MCVETQTNKDGGSRLAFHARRTIAKEVQQTKMSKTLRKKISVNLQPGVDNMMNEAGELLGLRPSEVVNDAVKLFRFAVTEVRNGRRLYTADADGENRSEIVMFLDPSLLQNS